MTYPHQPGYKAEGTSMEAAEANREKAPTLREQCLRVLKEQGPLTADEVAARLEKSVLSVRPRVTELRKMGLVEATGERRENASGLKAEVLQAAVEVGIVDSDWKQCAICYHMFHPSALLGNVCAPCELEQAPPLAQGELFL
jgi:hypothetical protein